MKLKTGILALLVGIALFGLIIGTALSDNGDETNEVDECSCSNNCEGVPIYGDDGNLMGYDAVWKGKGKGKGDPCKSCIVDQDNGGITSPPECQLSCSSHCEVAVDPAGVEFCKYTGPGKPKGNPCKDCGIINGVCALP